MKNRLLAGLLGLLASCSALAATTFPVFGPATGVLKGNAASPLTSAAAYSDIVSMWVSCSSPATKVLLADGTCDLWSAPVTPAALTKTDDTNVTLTLGGTPATSLLQATSITAGWTGTLAASRGGLGMSTVTDDTVAVANGSAWQSKALTDCDAATSAVTYDTTTNAWGCNSISGAVGANPTGTIGLSAVNGVATTFLRSDGAPALSQSIAPTWTGKHAFTGSAWASGTGNISLVNSGPVFEIGNSSAGTDAKYWFLFPTTTQLVLDLRDDARTSSRNALAITRSSFGVSSMALGNDTDNPSYVLNGEGLTTIDGGVVVGTPTGGSQGVGAINATGLYINGVSVAGGTTTSGTFTATLTGGGFAGTVTCTMKYRLTGSQVAVFVDSGGSCTGSASSNIFTWTGLPVAIRPNTNATSANSCVDAAGGGNAVSCLATFQNSGAVQMSLFTGTVYDPTGWSTSGTKGISSAVFMYDRRN